MLIDQVQGLEKKRPKLPGGTEVRLSVAGDSEVGILPLMGGYTICVSGTSFVFSGSASGFSG